MHGALVIPYNAPCHGAPTHHSSHPLWLGSQFRLGRAHRTRRVAGFRGSRRVGRQLGETSAVAMCPGSISPRSIRHRSRVHRCRRAGRRLEDHLALLRSVGWADSRIFRASDCWPMSHRARAAPLALPMRGSWLRAVGRWARCAETLTGTIGVAPAEPGLTASSPRAESAGT